MPNFYTEHKHWINWLLFIVILLVAVYVFASYLLPFFAPFVAGFIVALMLEMPVRLLSKKISRGKASAACLFMFIVIVGLLSATIVNKIISEARSFLVSVPNYVGDVGRIADDVRANLSGLIDLIPESLRDSFTEINIMPMITSSLGSGVKTGSWNVVSNIPGFFLNTILCLVSAFFFMRDRELIFSIVRDKTPSWFREHVSVVKKGMVFAVLGYFKAQLILMSITSCILISGLLIIRYPYALFVGLLIAIIDMLPIFGSGSVLWPWAAYSFINGNISNGIGLIVIYLVVLVTRQTLEPRILGSQIGVHPLLTLLSMYTGLKFLGVIGLILGPAVVITVKAVVHSRRLVEKEENNNA
jgi:sporulation integral membrane protein YtvI